jgi:hypothetical protein
MIVRFLYWLEDLERQGVVKRKEDVVNAMIVLGCILSVAGIVLLVLAWRR